VRTVEKSARYRSSPPKEGRSTAGSAYPSTGNPGTRTLKFFELTFLKNLLTRSCVDVCFCGVFGVRGAEAVGCFFPDNSIFAVFLIGLKKGKAAFENRIQGFN